MGESIIHCLKEGTTLQDGKFTILRILGQGGFGITYLARHTLLNREVAIKEFFIQEFCNRDSTNSFVTVATQSNAETVDRLRKKFLKEARNLAQFTHNNIVKVYDVFEENSTAYYVMEYIDGKPLSDIITQRGKLPESVALKYVREVGAALQTMHGKHINHLDVKPSNIMIRNHSDDVVLIDFGLSKEYDVHGNQLSTTLIGISSGYAPLEQYEKDGLKYFTPQADVYALGATLFKMVTGINPPSQSEIRSGFLRQSLAANSPIITRAIEAAMKAFKEDRPASVSAFLQLLPSVSTPSQEIKTPPPFTKGGIGAPPPFSGGTPSSSSVGQPPIDVVDAKPVRGVTPLYNQEQQRTSSGKKTGLIIGLIALGVAVTMLVLFLLLRSNSKSTNDYITDSYYDDIEALVADSTVAADEYVEPTEDIDAELESAVELEKSTYPSTLENGLTVYDARLTSSYLVYYYSYDENVVEITNDPSSLRTEIENLYQTDTDSQKMLDMLAQTNRGVSFVYTGDQTGKKTTLNVSPSQLRSITNSGDMQVAK